MDNFNLRDVWNKRLGRILNRKSLEYNQGPSLALKTSLLAYEFAQMYTSPHRLVNRAAKLRGSILELTDLRGKATTLNLDNFRSIYIV